MLLVCSHLMVLCDCLLVACGSLWWFMVDACFCIFDSPFIDFFIFELRGMSLEELAAATTILAFITSTERRKWGKTKKNCDQ